MDEPRPEPVEPSARIARATIARAAAFLLAERGARGALRCAVHRLEHVGKSAYLLRLKEGLDEEQQRALAQRLAATLRAHPRESGAWVFGPGPTRARNLANWVVDSASVAAGLSAWIARGQRDAVVREALARCAATYLAPCARTKRIPAQRVGYINRVGSNRVMTVSANVAEGVQTAKVQQEIAAELNKTDLGVGVTWKLKGEDEEREKAGAFLMGAFGTAIFLIFAILLAQFNRLTSVGLVLTAVVLSTIGVLLGLLIMGQPFGVVMTGIGIIANAGVIVNNNIVLIDTYDRLRREGVAAYDAVIETCRERARPVVLTAVTAILGVLPIAFGVNLDFLLREVAVGAPSTQWWISLSTAIVFGLGFATILTLIVTPAALMGIAILAEKRGAWMAKMRARLGRRRIKVAS